ncbi:DUF7507 domain-containing protein [Saccharothrix sp. CB00851]|uniref:DUF7507 domain-containing protein n=1 Tax=Saccharothrix sp. CB00851 TaxID=1835005 RepID=UPI003FD09C25
MDAAARLTLDKQAALVDTNGDGKAQVGERIDYAFVVTNTGSVTVTDPTIADDRLAGAGIAVTCPTGPLAPGDQVTCTASYVVTQVDVTAGSVVNTATATGKTPGGDNVSSPPDVATVPSGEVPGAIPPKPTQPPVLRPEDQVPPSDDLSSTGVSVALTILGGLAALVLGLLALFVGRSRRER